MKLFKKLVEYTTKEGLKKKAYNLYLMLENGDLIAIKNAYTKTANDYYRLLAVARPYIEYENLLEKDLPY